VPVFGLDTGMPSIKVVPAGDQSRQGYDQVQAAFGEGAPGALQVVGAQGEVPRAVTTLERDPGIARVLPPQPGREGLALVQAIPAQDPSSPEVGRSWWAAPRPRTTTSSRRSHRRPRS
jgi:RND superfamily putative drug exporter